MASPGSIGASFSKTRAGAPAHTFTRANDFMGLTPPLRNFFRAGFRGRDPGRLRREDGEAAVVFRASTRPKTAKAKVFFAKRTSGFAAGVVSH